MRWFRQSSDNPSADWRPLTSVEQFSSLLEGNDVLAVFKHSSRCSISSVAMSRLDREWNANVPIYLVDVLAHRAVSNAVEEVTGVRHESPQFLVIRGGEVVYAASHTGIDTAEALQRIAVEEAG